MASVSTRGSDAMFLNGGGEMGALMRAHDWAATPLGSPEAWPQPLRMSIRLLLNTGHPMYVWWGPDLLCFYNDAYRQSIGPERHPSSLGRPAREVWAEIWDIIGPQIEQVMSGGGATWHENQLVPITRAGAREEVYWTYSYGPIDDETAASGVGGVLVVCTETTETVLAQRRAAEMQEHQQQMLRQMPGFVGMLSGPDLVYTYVNDAYVAISERTDFVGRRFRDVFADIEGQGYFEAFENAFHSGESVVTRGMELRLHGRDEPQYVDFVLEPIRNDAGAVTGLFVGGYEITEIYRGNAALRKSEERQRFLLELGDHIRGITDPEAIIAEASRALGERLGAVRVAYAEIDGPENRGFIRGQWTAGDAPRLPGEIRLSDFGMPLVNRLRAGGTLAIEDVRFDPCTRDQLAALDAIGARALVSVPLFKDGAFAVNLNVHQDCPWTWTDGEVTLIEAVAERTWDAVQRARADARLHDAEERYLALFNSIDQGFCTIEVAFDEDDDPTDYRFLEVSPSFERQTGIRNGAGRWMREIAADQDQHWFDTYGRVALTGEPARFESYSTPLARWWDVYAFRISGPNRVALLFRDISDQKRAEAALRESEARLRDLNETLEHRVTDALAERRVLADVIDGTDIFVQVADREFNWLAINGAAADEFARIFGVRRPKAGDNMLEMLGHRPDDRAAVEAVWSRALGGEEFVEVDEFGDPSLDRRYYEMRFRALRDADGRAVGAYQFVSNVTERLREQYRLKEAEEALRQSQKMEAMGSLTGGVAHDFNNLLTPIIGSLDMLVRRGVGSERERRLIDGALQSAERAKTLVQRLLAFARRQPLQPVSVDIPKLVEGMVGLIGSTLGPTIDVRVDLAPGLPSARADPNQLEMALLNLAVNARDAMPDGGELTINAKRESVDHRGHASALKPGHYVLLCVVDTGTGMDEATRQRAIEPFFSTKGVGKGTGLGLSMVHGLAAQLGGGLTIESAPGRGTAIELWLPISTAPLGSDEASTAAPTARVGRGVALLVDDEELVRLSTADMLIDLGFEVVEAGSAEDALQLLKTGMMPNLLITDHLMPGMNGADLAREARGMQPTLPVLIVSGYAEVDGLAPDLPRLTKPFRNAELAASVAALIPSAAG